MTAGESIQDGKRISLGKEILISLPIRPRFAECPLRARRRVSNLDGSGSDPRGNDAPSAESRHEQITSKHHLVGGEAARRELKMCHTMISWEKKAAADLGEVCHIPTCFRQAATNPKTS